MELKDAVLAQYGEAHNKDAQIGRMNVINGGLYLARFSVSYQIGDHEFTKYSGDFTLGGNKDIYVPEIATNIYLKVEEMWGFGWLTIFTKTYPKPTVKCFKISGSTLKPKWEEIRC